MTFSICSPSFADTQRNIRLNGTLAEHVTPSGLVYCDAYILLLLRKPNDILRPRILLCRRLIPSTTPVHDAVI